MKKRVLTVIASLQLAVVLFVFLGLTRLGTVKGTIVYPELFKMILYAVLAFLSSMGILFSKKVLLLATVYLYPFLILERLDRLFFVFSSNKANLSPDGPRRLYTKEIISAGIFMTLYLAAIMLIISESIRAEYQLEQRTVLINLGIAITAGFFLVRAY